MKHGHLKAGADRPGREAPVAVETHPRDAATFQWWCQVGAGLLVGVLLIVLGLLSTSPLMRSADNYTDCNILVAGENFAQHGFFRLHWLPVQYVTPSAAAPIYYLHYPPLAEVLNGLMQAAGIRSLWGMRMLCGALFVAGLFCTYRAFAPLIGLLAALCGLAVVGTSGFFLAYATSLHHSYNVFFMGLFLLLFMRAVRAEQPARLAWAGAWVVLLLASLVSYEFVLYPQIFAWVYVIGTGQLRRRWKMLLVLGTAPAVGLALHFLQNCWAVGYAVAIREGFGYAGYTYKGRWFWLKRLPEVLLERSQHRYFWPWPVLLLLAGAVLGLSERFRHGADLRRCAASLFLALLLAPLGWYVFMVRHAWVHPHTVSQLFPLVFAALGSTTALAGRLLFRPGSPLHTRFLAVLALLVVVGGQVQTLSWWREEWKPTVVETIEAIGPDALPPKAALLHNTTAPHFAYFIRRPAWRSLPSEPKYPLPECVPALQQRLPEGWKLQYYLFFGSGDRGAFELLASTCVGRQLVAPRLGGSQVVLFDLTPLHLPENQRPPLPPGVREEQLRGVFPEWQLRGFPERLDRAYAKYASL